MLMRDWSNNMKTLDEYLKLPYKVDIIPDTEEGGFIAIIPELKGCISCGNTIEATIQNLSDAKKAWLIAAIKNGIEIPEPKNARRM